MFKSKYLQQEIELSVKDYLNDMDGGDINNLYSIFLVEVEKGLFSEVLRRYRGNISASAECLGISRVTLRKKLIHLGFIKAI